MKPTEKPLPGFETLISENVSENSPQRKAKKILENISEKPKAKRGRKLKYTEKDYAPYTKKKKWAQTQRGRQNYILCHRVYTILAFDRERFQWILGANGHGKKFKRDHKSPRMRLTILAELGRFVKEDESLDLAAIDSTAKQICAARMNTRQAIGYCRRLRGKGKPSISELAALIRATVKRYQERHPRFSDADVKIALREVASE